MDDLENLLKVDSNIIFIILLGKKTRLPNGFITYFL